jgi:hypothetical protein
MPIAGAKWAEWSLQDAGWVRRRVIGITVLMLVVAGFTLAQCRLGLIHFPFKDPLTEASGWESLGPALKERGLLHQPHTFIFTDRWYDSGQLAFALRDENVTVLCYSHGDAHGFAQWHNPDDWVGWDGLLVTPRTCPKEIETMQCFFEKIELVDEFPMTRGGSAFRPVRVYRCSRQTRPFPFRYGDAVPAELCSQVCR